MRRSFYLFLLAALAVSACGGRPQARPDDPKAGPAQNQPPSGKSYTTVQIASTDGTPIYGSMYAAKNANSPAVLLLHQWMSDRHSFDEFADHVHDRGFAVLSIDGRGFGESNRRSDGSKLDPGRTDADVKAMLGDVDVAFSYLSQQPNVDPKKVGILGASYGSSLALIYAADHPQVGAVAMLSPGLNYFGSMQTEPAVKKYGERPLLMFAAADDKESADAARKLGDADPKATTRVYSSGGHGIALFALGIAEPLAKFFKDSLQN
ncbi:MAG TPA: alpha/beta fold hydrolase [Pyrinomonadaceae bacterium]|nr:alpha/beta fold hydrolase [Pyrinomonadaceae bacterium]